MGNNELARLLMELPPELRQQLAGEALLEKNRRQASKKQQLDFAGFKHRFWRGYIETPFQAAIDALLMDVAAYILSGGEHGVGKAMIFMPPRHGKTLNISRMFPAWLLSLLPELQIITCSYAATLAYANSRATRSLVTSLAYQELFPATQVAGSKRVDLWSTSSGGGVLAAGVLGGVTGHGARLIIVDDPHKSRHEVESSVYRGRVHEWFYSDLLTRLEEPGGAIIVMATRWNFDDLPGHLLNADDGDEWRLLSLPALALDDDLLGREPGEALWPERYSAEWLQKRAEQMGSYIFESLYQQHPITREAALFDTTQIRIVDTVPECEKVVRFYDLAVSAKKTADYTAGVKLGKKRDGGYIVLDVYRRQAAPTATAEAIVTNAMRDGKDVAIRLEATNDAVVQLDFLLRDPRLSGFTIDAKRPEGDKYVRATPVASRVNGGTVELLRGSWNSTFLDELATFPAGRNDDMVDALSGGYDMLATASILAFVQHAVNWGDHKPRQRPRAW